ncbi:hypothetical protein M501DRAFT_807537 [Patellaria atrata CBS 101060]|uniref:Uncharacterized protein n=1 Tax=Patellaria atrata CBS 101060 TaxID=1346257 RepID=A0A9P4VQL7_9PEZI|nr:hypothetical protein M501DRAFT_807537 [Patellaria atrata CBS 101060]
MYFDRSKVYPATTSDQPLRTYVGNNGVSTELEDLFHDILVEAITLPPQPLLPTQEYSYTTSIHIPQTRCQQVNAGHDQVLDLEDVAVALTPILENRVLFDLNVEVLNVTMNERYDFTYQTRKLSSNGGQTSTGPLSGSLHHIALAGTVDPDEGHSFIRTPVRIPSLELDSSTKRRPVLDGSLYIAWSNPSHSGVNVTRCELYNSSVEVKVEVESRHTSIHLITVLEIGEPLSQNTALWEASSENRSWTSLALNAWMHQLYAQIQASAGYLPEMALEWNYLQLNSEILAKSKEYSWHLADGETRTPRVLVGRQPRPFGDWIEELSLNFSLSLMSDPRFW